MFLLFKDDDLAAEAEDQFNIEVMVTSPTKVGDGMGAYLVYHVKTLVSAWLSAVTTLYV